MQVLVAAEEELLTAEDDAMEAMPLDCDARATLQVKRAMDTAMAATDESLLLAEELAAIKAKNAQIATMKNGPAKLAAIKEIAVGVRVCEAQAKKSEAFATLAQSRAMHMKSEDDRRREARFNPVFTLV